MSSATLSIALIGFGEVGRTFARGWCAGGSARVAAYDLTFDDPARAAEPMAAARDIGVRVARSGAEAAEGAAVVVSAVTADQTLAVARDAAGYLTPGQILLDVNSASPRTKIAAAALVQASGAAYVEGAVMAPVRAPGLRVPILAGGPAAETLAGLLNPLGMAIRPVARVHGRASAMKLSRSIMIKGLEALIIDAARAARTFDVEAEVYGSLAETFPGIDWPALAATMAERVAVHGVRRAAEMREAADMLADAGLDPALALAVADAQARGAAPR